MWIVILFLVGIGVGCATDDGTGLRCDAPTTVAAAPLVVAENDH